jgi:diguanylate cyclase (GGDEF)-like protein
MKTAAVCRRHPLAEVFMRPRSPLPHRAEPEIHDAHATAGPTTGRQTTRVDLVTPTPSEQRHPTVTFLAGADMGRIHRFDAGRTVAGRDPGVELPIDCDLASRRHAEFILCATGETFVRDLDSTNGTLVNGEQVRGLTRQLHEGDRIQIGSVTLKFALQDPLEEAVQHTLYGAATRDPLTGVYNRRHLFERFEQEFAFAIRHATPLALALFDLDHFKRINDRYGHDAGDTVLRAVADYIRARVRCEDVFARYGGEEFALLMRDTTLAQAGLVADRVRSGLSRHAIDAGNAIVTMTLSAGVAATTCGKFETPTDLVRQADRLLYEAKSAGRDCTCCARAA